jgi:pimeloyl-ACP methyl ester carboxylesterase
LSTETADAKEKFGPFDNRSLAAIRSWEEHWLDLSTGRMRYLQAGRGRPLILIHGLLGYSFSWRFSMPALARHATVYAIDNLGAGFSVAPPDLDCSMRGTAERVLAFADALGLSEFDLLGTSHGGAVAMMAAAICAGRADPRLKRLVLVAPVNPWSRHGRRLAPFIASRLGSHLFRHTIAKWRFLDYLWLRRIFGDGSRIPPDSLDGYRRPVLENHAFEHGRRIVQTWLADLADLERSLPTIRDYPTLLMWGTRDRAVSYRSAARLQGNFTSCRLVTFQGVGHLPYEETPEDFNRELIKFLEARRKFK